MTDQNAETKRLDTQGDASPAASKPVDDRIAPGVSGPNKSEDETTAATPEAKRPSTRRLSNRAFGAVAACAVALVAVLAGVGYATGLFGVHAEQAAVTAQQEESGQATVAKTQASSSSDSTAQTQGDSQSDKKFADEKSDAASGAEAGGGETSSLPATPSGEAAAQAEASASDASSSAGSESSSSAGSSYQEPAPEPAPAPEPSTISVYISIDSSRAQAYGLGGFGYGATVQLPQGATVYDALCATGAAISGSSYYVSAINGLAEKQCGNGSGWTYAVNGSFPGKACGRYTLSGGESIAWIYSTEKDPTIAM